MTTVVVDLLPPVFDAFNDFGKVSFDEKVNRLAIVTEARHGIRHLAPLALGRSVLIAKAHFVQEIVDEWIAWILAHTCVRLAAKETKYMSRGASWLVVIANAEPLKQHKIVLGLIVVVDYAHGFDVLAARAVVTRQDARVLVDAVLTASVSANEKRFQRLFVVTRRLGCWRLRCGRLYIHFLCRF